MDVFAVLAQINDQLSQAPDLDSFLKIVVGVIKDLTQFHRCLVYSFDSQWNGLVVAELVDWSKTHDLYKGLQFPATDIPAQARELYRINKVRLLYDRTHTTARMVLRSKRDLDNPVDMTHCYLRAMSPIHMVCEVSFYRLAEAALTNTNFYATGLPQEHGGSIEHVYREQKSADYCVDASRLTYVPLASYSRSWLSEAFGVSSLATVMETMACESASQFDRCSDS